ncbi:MAG TPA: hypothetical protein VM367_06365 [Pseudonocardia sp.]|jgi:hypothetical protein|nr:hypothetical protein [Pseudonocardia sp.]
MWEPVGPLPASVYWRRRCVAAAVAVTVLVGLAWSAAALVAPAGRDREHLVVGTVASAGSPTESTAGEPAVAPASSSRATTSAPATSGDAVDPTDPTGVASERLRPDDNPRATSPLPSPLPVPPTGPVPCTDEMIAVTAEVDAPEHRVGDRPVLRLVIANVSEQPCVRDLDSQHQEIVVWSEDLSERLWSSNDCVNAPSTDLRTLVPGQPVAFSVRWAGRTSTPGCAEERTVVPAGSYQVRTRLGDVVSPPTAFRRVP